jgi:hypothetical protein
MANVQLPFPFSFRTLIEDGPGQDPVGMQVCQFTASRLLFYSFLNLIYDSQSLLIDQFGLVYVPSFFPTYLCAFPS